MLETGSSVLLPGRDEDPSREKTSDPLEIPHSIPNFLTSNEAVADQAWQKDCNANELYGDSLGFEGTQVSKKVSAPASTIELKRKGEGSASMTSEE